MFNVRISAFCLMSNHYHILIQTPEGNLSRAMRHLNGVYTQRYNRRKKIDGQLFRGRYKSILVGGDSYLLELLRYIHRNPVRARICKTVDDYTWSSHKGYISSAKKWNWLHKEFLLLMFSEGKLKARNQYRDFVQEIDSEQITDFFGKKKLESFFGSKDFVDWIKSTYHQMLGHKEIPQSRHLAPTIAEIKKTICHYYKIDSKSLEQGKRGQINEPRNVAVYLARKKCGLRLEEIGENFGITTYSTVSSIVTRTEKQISQNKKFKTRVDEIGLMLKDMKSQAKT